MNKTTNIILNKALEVLLIMVMLLGLMSLAGCQREPFAVGESESCVVIKTTEKELGGNTEMLLIDYMAELKTKGELDYTTKNGMVNAINGIETPADFSKSWMLYTSDEDSANAAWGTIKYEGKKYGSAVLGAETLKLKPEHLYIWVFKDVE